MNINLKYSTLTVQLAIPESSTVLQKKPIFSTFNPEKFKNNVSQKLNKNLEGKKVAVVIADKSRRCAYPTLLPLLTGMLKEKGIAKNNITFYIAYGTHRKQTNKESVYTYGSLFHEYKFVHHNCTDATIFKNLGTTQLGTEITIRKDVLESDVIITLGAISYHYFAGFGGGRKLLFPGLASKEAILHNHRLFLDPQKKQLHKNCKPGNLTENPLSNDLLEISSLCPPHIEIHGLLNETGELADAWVGSSHSDFVKACEQHRKNYTVQTNKRYDVVLASAGGYPKDLNFIQAHKAIHHASLFAREGGKIIVFAECSDGIGSDTFLEHFRFKYNEAFDRISGNYTGNGGTALSMMEKNKRFDIYMHTILEKENCELIGIQKIGVKEIEAMLHSDESILVLNNPTAFILG